MVSREFELPDIDAVRQWHAVSIVGRLEVAGLSADSDLTFYGEVVDQQGQPVAIYAFVMVLGFSRMLYVEFTTEMSLETLLRCHPSVSLRTSLARRGACVAGR